MAPDPSSLHILTRSISDFSSLFNYWIFSHHFCYTITNHSCTYVATSVAEVERQDKLIWLLMILACVAGQTDSFQGGKWKKRYGHATQIHSWTIDSIFYVSVEFTIYGYTVVFLQNKLLLALIYRLPNHITCFSLVSSRLLLQYIEVQAKNDSQSWWDEYLELTWVDSSN